VKLFLVINNIRSTYNVGAMFRTADAVGVEKVYLCGYTPSPTDRFGRTQPAIAKTALGAEQSVPWEHVDDVHTVIASLKREGVTVVALEQHERAVPYTEYKTKTPTALVVGEEVDGLPEDIIDRCDAVVDIPMHGSKESLNVSVAAGITLYTLIEQ
jgi:tRNA G18 (ribose-2'-O)-methylase SpoU